LSLAKRFKLDYIRVHLNPAVGVGLWGKKSSNSPVGPILGSETPYEAKPEKVIKTCSSEFSMRQLLEAGVHVVTKHSAGTHVWVPFIYGAA